MRIETRNWWVAVGIVSIVLAAGCGDDPVPAEGSDTGEDKSEQMTAEDCADDEFFHPVNEECVADTDDEGDGDEEDSPNIGDGDDDDDLEEIEECGLGGIQGESCRPDGGVLPGATVVLEGVDCEDDESFKRETTADTNGMYAFDNVPAGHHELTITSGSFTNTEQVTVLKDEVTDLTDETAKVCLHSEQAEIAIFDGNFDDVRELLENMDVSYDFYSGGSSLGDDALDLLLDQDALLEYDILFLECQVDEPSAEDEREIALSNIRRFLSEGNSVYASDRAHPWIYMAEPDAIPFELDYSADPETSFSSFRSQIQTGSPAGRTGTYTAEVVSDEMQTLLGTDPVEFYFDTGSWTIVSADDVDEMSGTVHFRLDPEEGSFFGSGDTYEGASAITTFDDPIGNGRIIYTSFHNSQQEQIDDTMEEILEYLIFQL